MMQMKRLITFTKGPIKKLKIKIMRTRLKIKNKIK